MAKNFDKDVVYGQWFQDTITTHLEANGCKVADTHRIHSLGWDIVVIPPNGKRKIKVELKRQREFKHFFELTFKGAKSKWRGNADQLWTWSDGNSSFEVYDAKVLEAHLLKLKFEGHSFKCGDKDAGYPSNGVIIPFNCVEAGYITSFSLEDITP